MLNEQTQEEMRRNLVANHDGEESTTDESESTQQALSNQDHDMSSAYLELSAIVGNFTRTSILFSLNHGCVVACLTLATARLGSLGAWQSALLYLSYTLSALLGSTTLVQRFGSKTSMMIGMGLYGLYVGCFVVALKLPHHYAKLVAYGGALLGGSGAGCLWTAQGAYFSHAAEAYDKVQAAAGEEGEPSWCWSSSYSSFLVPICCSTAKNEAHKKDASSSTTASTGTTKLAGIFAFWYLAAEVAMRLFSSIALEWHLASWEGIFLFYTLLTVASALGMRGIEDYQDVVKAKNSFDDLEDHPPTSSYPKRKWWHKATSTVRLLAEDSKMKYLVGLNAVFGFASAFVNTYLNGAVVAVVLQDPESKYLGILSSYTSAVAAVMSLVFARITPHTGRGVVLIVGALAFGGVVLPFLVQPNIQTFGDSSTLVAWMIMLTVYGLMGIGRATFEGTLKATFADYFPYAKEGAFANIILQNGFFTSVSYVLTFLLPCNQQSAYCAEYADGSTQYVLVFEVLVLASALVAILGYLQASRIHQREQQQSTIQEHERDEEDPTVQHESLIRRTNNHESAEDEKSDGTSQSCLAGTR